MNHFSSPALAATANEQIAVKRDQVTAVDAASHTIELVYPRLPRRDWRMLMVAMAAVSARKMGGPKVMG